MMIVAPDATLDISLNYNDVTLPDSVICPRLMTNVGSLNCLGEDLKNAVDLAR
jgi:hypothetical protein